MACGAQIDVPNDLSMVAVGSGESCGRGITGMLPDFHHMIGLCLGMLERPQSTGCCGYTEVMLRMRFVHGQTLRILSRTASPCAGERAARRGEALGKAQRG